MPSDRRALRAAAQGLGSPRALRRPGRQGHRLRARRRRRRLGDRLLRVKRALPLSRAVAERGARDQRHERHGGDAEPVLDEARGLASRLGVAQRIVSTSELEDPRYVRNDPDRCYYCKTQIFSELRKLAEREGFAAVASAAKDCGMRSAEVRVKGPGPGRESAVRALNALGFRIQHIEDVTPIPHNGCRPPKKRRV